MTLERFSANSAAARSAVAVSGASSVFAWFQTHEMSHRARSRMWSAPAGPSEPEMGIEPMTPTLPRLCSASELLGPDRTFLCLNAACRGHGGEGRWAVEDSNLRRRKPSDLQSLPVGRLGNCPWNSVHWRACAQIHAPPVAVPDGLSPGTPRFVKVSRAGEALAYKEVSIMVTTGSTP